MWEKEAFTISSFCWLCAGASETATAHRRKRLIRFGKGGRLSENGIGFHVQRNFHIGDAFIFDVAAVGDL